MVKRVMVNLDHNDHELLRQLAFDKKVSLSSLVRSAISVFISNKEAKKA